MYNDDENISASEINRYTYCPNQWYYERYYGRKLLREKYNERNAELGYKDSSRSNLSRGLKFHENYLSKYRVRRLVKVIIEIAAAVIILLLILAIIRGGEEIKKSSPELNITGYKLFYADQSKGERKEGIIYKRLLKSEKYGLHGKPDFIFRRKNKLIPVELKSGKAGDAPNNGDLLQLCAYMLIIEDVFSANVPEGRLIYKNAMFKVRNTKRMRSAVLETAEDMRAMLLTGQSEKSPNANFAKCKSCICRDTVCFESVKRKV